MCGLEAGIGTHAYTVAKAGVVASPGPRRWSWPSTACGSTPSAPATSPPSLAAGRSVSDVDAEEMPRRLDQAREPPAVRSPSPGWASPTTSPRPWRWLLASDDSVWVTGTAQVVDGGLITGKPWRSQPAVMTERRPIRMYAPGTYE